MVLDLHVGENAKRILMAFVGHTTTNADLEWIPVDELKELFRLETKYPAAIINIIFDNSLVELTNLCILRTIQVQQGIRSFSAVRIHESFIEPALELYLPDNVLSHELLASTSQKQIPAADRFVSTKDNQSEIDAATRKLDELKERIQNSNELKANTEERLALSQEVTALQDALKNPVVRISSIWNAVKNNGVVAYLSTHGGDAVLNALAIEAVGHILRALQLS